MVCIFVTFTYLVDKNSIMQLSIKLSLTRDKIAENFDQTEFKPSQIWMRLDKKSCITIQNFNLFR